MNKKLLPKGVNNLRDPSGKEVDYDIPILVFANGKGAGTLEQLVLSLYFRGGEAVIKRPYVVRQVEQPLTKFFANQLAIRHVEQLSLDTWDAVAQYLASEDVLIVPALWSDVAREFQSRFDRAFEAYKKWKEHRSIDVDEITEMFRAAIIPAARIRIPEIIGLYYEFLRRYEKPDDPSLAPNFDFFRRIVEKSLQDTLNSSRETIANLLVEFDKQPTIRNARLLDVFARQHVHLGFVEDKVQFYNYVRKAYFAVVNSQSPIKDRISAYASLIVFDLLLNDDDARENHFRQLRKLHSTHPKTIFLERKLVGYGPLWASTSKSGMIGLDNHYSPELTDILLERIGDYRATDTSIPFPVDAMEQLINHAKKTNLKDIAYQMGSDGISCRYLRFNHDPHVVVCNQTGAGQTDNGYVIVQAVDAGYFSVVDRIGGFFGRDPMKKGRIFGEPNLKDILKTDVDKYLYSVPELALESDSHGAQMRATLPTSPRLAMAGMDGMGLIDPEKIKTYMVS